MNRTSYHGKFRTGDGGVAQSLLEAWLQTDALNCKVRMTGVEITYETDGLYMFCQEAPTGPGESPRYLLEGHIDAPPDAAAERLRPLLKICEVKGVDFNLEYVEVDEAGDEIGDEASLE